METQKKHIGKVVKVFTSEQKGYVRCDDFRDPLYFNIDKSPGLRKSPAVGTEVQFDVIPSTGGGFDDRAINIEVI